MTADLIDDEREAAVTAMLAAYDAEFNHTNNAFKRPMRAALAALLAAGRRQAIARTRSFPRSTGKAPALPAPYHAMPFIGGQPLPLSLTLSPVVGAFPGSGPRSKSPWPVGS